MMNKSVLLLLLTVLFSCEREPSVSSTQSGALTAELDSLYQEDMFRGFSVAIVNEDGFTYNRGFGYADVEAEKPFTEETIINIASISKVFVGVALIKALDLGLLELDDPVNEYLPFQVIHPGFPDRPITIRHLATHTSSIVDGDIYMETDYINKDNRPIDPALQEKYGLYYQNSPEQWMPLDDYLASILQEGQERYEESTFADRTPGELYEYSNIGTALCALVIESAADRPFDAFTRQYIFEPLGMTATGWTFEDVDMTAYSKLYYDDFELPYYHILSYPDGALITSSTDLGVFLSELIKGHLGKGTLLSTSGYEELFRFT